MRLDDLNALDQDAAARTLLQCCGSTRWAARMAAARPFATFDRVAASADDIWSALDEADWLEAFAAHPRIGDDRSNRSGGSGGPGRSGEPRKSAGLGQHQAWAAQEQARVSEAARGERDRLAAGNREYEARFGYIFIVCAAGKSAAQMLGMLESRLTNDSKSELRIAANEQRQITRLRLAKLLDGRQDTVS
jgi:2-oxo-4-hydroxy-4-carboxy-5-ureidoimidazoline decarboxylase